MRLFELRAEWVEYYNCPDNGITEICENYDVIAISVGDDEELRVIAGDLTRGFDNNTWSLDRVTELRKLYPEFDYFRETTYRIHEITDLLI